MENNFLSSHLEIKEKIINLFAQIKTRRVDFVFKWMDQAWTTLFTNTDDINIKEIYINNDK